MGIRLVMMSNNTNCVYACVCLRVCAYVWTSYRVSPRWGVQCVCWVVSIHLWGPVAPEPVCGRALYPGLHLPPRTGQPSSVFFLWYIIPLICGLSMYYPSRKPFSPPPPSLGQVLYHGFCVSRNDCPCSPLSLLRGSHNLNTSTGESGPEAPVPPRSIIKHLCNTW